MFMSLKVRVVSVSGLSRDTLTIKFLARYECLFLTGGMVFVCMHVVVCSLLLMSYVFLRL